MQAGPLAFVFPSMVRCGVHPPEMGTVTGTSAPHANDEDVELAARAARSDLDAQRALVVRLIGSVRRTVRSLLRSDAEADDALQVSMIEVLRSAGSYRGEGSLEGWAGRIAARTTLRFVRQRRARAELVTHDTEASERAEAHPVVEELTPGAALACLASLPEARRTCLLLRHVHGYTVDEIAELTSVSSNTVKDRLLVGRSQLREMVRRDEETGDRVIGRRARRRIP
jgi:RNA polymerase sigma-70 factor (ECF subfamily)